VDTGSTGKLAEYLTGNHVIPFILGTTGESASMSPDQKVKLAETVIRTVNGRTPVLAGISSNSMKTSIDLAIRFADLGVEAAVANLPSYYPMDDDQIMCYSDQLASHIPIPLFLYNMPVTTGFSISLEILEKLSHHPNIAGFKDSERDPERLERSLEIWPEREDFSFLLGWAAMSVYGLSKGADGIVPSTANLVPDLYFELYKAVLEGLTDKAESLQERTEDISMLYQENRKLNQSIPALKVLLSIRGLSGPSVLPPLYRMEEEEEQRYYREMKAELEKLAD
jgi:4-hydroxy-tetrahydrodipicolinate synthase